MNQPCTAKKHQAMKDDGYAKCWDCGESFYAERKPPVVASNELLAELSAILAKSLGRGLDEENQRECRWLVELPMTDAEYYRMKEIITANPTGQVRPEKGGGV